MKNIKILTISIMLTMASQANDKVYVKFLKTENPAGGMHTWTSKYLVREHGKKCIYDYSVGLMRGHIKNTCTGEEHLFPIRPDKPYAKPYKYKIRPMIDPFFYDRAYQLLIEEGNKRPKDDTMVSMNNSKGVKIFCFRNMKACKTEKEVLDYINR